MQFSVLLSMTFDLLSHQKLTASYLSEKYKLSARTVYRYVDVLSTELPLQIKRGRSGGICLADNYRLPMGFMHADEYEAAIQALENAYAHSCDERFLSARRKLSMQNKTEKRNLALFGDTGNVYIGNISFGDLRTFAETLRIVEECVKKKLMLYIVYLDENGKKSQQYVEPHALVFENNAWYAYAFGHIQRGFTLFRIGAILSASKTETVFRKRPFPRDEAPFPSRQTDNTVCVRLEIQKCALLCVQDWLGAACMRYKNGVYLADAVVPDGEYLAAKIVSLGSGVKVLEPSSLRERVANIAAEITKLYI